MDELWSGDRAVLMKVAELYEGTGEPIEPLEQVLKVSPTISTTLCGNLCASWVTTATSTP